MIMGKKKYSKEMNQIEEFTDNLKSVLDENIKLTAADYETLQKRIDEFESLGMYECAAYQCKGVCGIGASSQEDGAEYPCRGYPPSFYFDRGSCH